MPPMTLLATVLAVGLTACGDTFLRETSSPAFTAGYRDGCRSGSSAASNLTGEVFRDEQRFVSDPDYATGWRNGNRNCDGQNLQANPTEPIEQIDVDKPILGL